MGKTSARNGAVPRDVTLGHHCDLEHLHPMGPFTVMSTPMGQFALQPNLCCRCGRVHLIYQGLSHVDPICGEFVHVAEQQHKGIVVPGEAPKLVLAK